MARRLRAALLEARRCQMAVLKTKIKDERTFDLFNPPEHNPHLRAITIDEAADISGAYVSQELQAEIDRHCKEVERKQRIALRAYNDMMLKAHKDFAEHPVLGVVFVTMDREEFEAMSYFHIVEFHTVPPQTGAKFIEVRIRRGPRPSAPGQMVYDFDRRFVYLSRSSL